MMELHSIEEESEIVIQKPKYDDVGSVLTQIPAVKFPFSNLPLINLLGSATSK